MAKTAGVLERPESTSSVSQTKHNSSNTQRRSRRGQRTSVAPKATVSRSETKKLGARGEEAAARFLEHRGYDILELNWKCYAGEADIIAKDDDWIVLVEVKTRRNADQGFPSEAVNECKRERFEKIAIAYLAESDFRDLGVRFDVISLVVLGKDKAMIRHHINAFTA